MLHPQLLSPLRYSIEDFDNEPTVAVVLPVTTRPTRELCPLQIATLIKLCKDDA